MLYNTHIMESEGTDTLLRVPMDCFKPNDSVLSSIDFKRMLKVMHFWGVSTLSVDMITYCDFYPFHEWIVIAEEELQNSRLLSDLQYVFCVPSGRLLRSVERNLVYLVQYFAVLHCEMETDKAIIWQTTERLDNVECRRSLEDRRYNNSSNN